MLYEEIKYKEKEFLSVTSLHVEEFEELLTYFLPICEKYFRYHTLDGKKRKFPSHTERGDIKLQGAAQKLLFLLVFLKTNALQEQHAISFDMSQTRVSRLSKILLPLLDETLYKMGLQPTRDGELLQKALAEQTSE
jgi:hypothetical protein